MRHLMLAWVAAALALTACDATSTGPDIDPGDTPAGVETPLAEVEVLGAGVDGFEHPPVDLPPTSRDIKRLSIDMLEGSIPVVAGDDAGGEPIRWTVVYQGTEYAVLDQDVLGATLGRPDWREVTAEPAEPTSLYLKFMDDMGREVCGRMIDADQATADAEARRLIRFAALDDADDADAIRANLRYLMLRFLGERVDDADAEATADLEALFDAGVATAAAGSSPALAGWTTVCVALFTSPAFHLY